jgi:ABC-type amino acid transport substrate-binding protein
MLGVLTFRTHRSGFLLTSRRRGGGRVRLCVCLAALVALWIGASAQTQELRLVSTVWPPFTNPPGQPRFALDLVEAATQRVGVKTSTAIVQAADFTSALLTGPYDGSAAAWKDDSRNRVLLFSQPYLENRLVVVGRHGSDVSARELGMLKGRRIAIVDGYSYGDGLEQSGPVFVRSRSEEDSLQMMLKGEVDYTLMDELVVQYILEHYEDEARATLQVGSTPLVTRELYFAVRRTLPDAQSIIDRFNGQLKSMIVDRTYHRLLHVKWIRADIDGDGITEYIPADDKPGPQAPSLAYTLFSKTPDSQWRDTPPTGFYVGGNIYRTWAEVPQPYKSNENMQPDARRSTASIFTFSF